VYPRRTTRRAIQVSSAAPCSRFPSRPSAPSCRAAEDSVLNSTAQHEWIGGTDSRDRHAVSVLPTPAGGGGQPELLCLGRSCCHRASTLGIRFDFL
jgi:hypothetical protein